GALCVAVAVLEHGATAAIVVAVAIVVLIQLEAHLLQPVIMSRSVAVHPLAIAISVISGTLLAGIAGALLAVPFIAFLNSTVRALRSEAGVAEQQSKFPVVDSTAVGGVGEAGPSKRPSPAAGSAGQVVDDLDSGQGGQDS
ncbi:MAG: AI-2E family transporter, partial [Jatrophihabitantaceae bacterium]